MGGDNEFWGFSKKLMLLVELIEAVGELDMCICRLVEMGEPGEWCRFCAIYDIAVEAIS